MRRMYSHPGRIIYVLVSCQGVLTQQPYLDSYCPAISTTLRFEMMVDLQVFAEVVVGALKF